MMLKNKLSLAIDYLEANDNTKMMQELKNKCSNPSEINNVITEVEAKAKNAKIDRANDKLPFYQIFLAYAYYLKGNWARAMHYAERAEAQFEKNNQKYNHAISLWILGFIYSYYEQIEQARTILDSSISALSMLHQEIYRSGHYISPGAVQYQEVIKEISDSFFEQKNELLKQLSTRKDRPTIDYELFSRVLALLRTPIDADRVYIDNWRNILGAMEPAELSNNKILVTEISTKADHTDDPIEKAFAQILLAHCHLLGFYCTSKHHLQYAEKLLRAAKEFFDTDDVNQLVINCYIDLIRYNFDVNCTGRLYLENVNRLLEEIKVISAHLGFKVFNEIKMLQIDIAEINFPFEFSGIVSQGNESSSKRGFRKFFSTVKAKTSVNKILTTQPLMSDIKDSPESLQAHENLGENIPSFEEVSKQNFDIAGTSLIVNRPGLSERIIDKMIQNALSENASVVFALSSSGGKYEKCKILHNFDNIAFIPGQIFRINDGTQGENAKAIAQIRVWLRERLRNENGFPIIFIFDTLQKWIEDLEVQIRYLIQEASHLNLSIWIHSPIFLIPTDLLPTIGNVVIIWPSKSEIKLLEDNLPGLDVDLESKKQLQGLFIYNERYGNTWSFDEFKPSLAN